MTTEKIQEDAYVAFMFTKQTADGKSERLLQYKPLGSQQWTDMPDVLENESSVHPGTIVANIYNFCKETVGFEFEGLTEPSGSQGMRRQFTVNRGYDLKISCDDTVILQPRPTTTNGSLIHFQLGDSSQAFEIVSASGKFTAHLGDSSTAVTSIPASTPTSKLVLISYDSSTEIEIKMCGDEENDRLSYDNSIIVCNCEDYSQYVGIKTKAADGKVRLWIDEKGTYPLEFGLPLPSATDEALELTFVIYDARGELIHGDPTFKTYNANSSIKS